MSQVIAAMKRQIPTVRALLEELSAARKGGSEAVATELMAHLGVVEADADRAELEANLARFVQALDRNDLLGAVSLWVKLAPVLRRHANRKLAQ